MRSRPRPTPGAEPIGACGHEPWTAVGDNSKPIPFPDGTRSGGGDVAAPALETPEYVGVPGEDPDPDRVSA